MGTAPRIEATEPHVPNPSKLKAAADRGPVDHIEP